MSTICASGRRRHLAATTRDFVARFGLKAGIIAVGAAVAAGTLHRTSYLPQTTIGHALVAANPADSASLIAKLSKAAQPSPLSSASGSLDLANEHSRVSFWVSRLS